jgi:ribosomal protein L7/L12
MRPNSALVADACAAALRAPTARHNADVRAHPKVMASTDQKPTLPLEAVSALHRGNKIEAIKIVREQQGVDLKEAKQRVEQFLRAEPSVQASFAEMRARSGQSALWWVAAIIGVIAVLVYLWQNP